MEKISLISLVTTPNLGWSAMMFVVVIVVLAAVFNKHLFYKSREYTSPEFIQAELFEQLKLLYNLVGEKLVIKYIEVVDFKKRKKFIAYVYFCIKNDADVLYKIDIVHTEGLDNLGDDAKNLLKSKIFSFDMSGYIKFDDEHISERTQTQLKVIFLDSGPPQTKIGEDYLVIP